MSRHLGPRKYAPLAAYLAEHTEDQVTLTLAEVEQIIGAALPSSASARGWWSNSAGLHHARAWRAVGWRVAAVNLGVRTVTFVRLPGDSPASLPARCCWVMDTGGCRGTGGRGSTDVAIAPVARIGWAPPDGAAGGPPVPITAGAAAGGHPVDCLAV